ncbi:MAG TPA: metalloregulator ArsR/SmtB family transcription factor [Dongiaceae bacterium]|jgi:DNA-binding transcriptional ArsR family regulator|nr:metalloregulator ArsR/SmtB family transcription factor [Dongiaceae bacterium]
MQSMIALADPNRRRMVEMLAGRELSAGEIGSEFEISAPAVSQHLKVLKEASIVRVRVDGQRRIYALDPAGFAELEQWLSRVRRFWLPRLDELERQMQRHKAEEAKKPNPKPRKPKGRKP